MSNVSFKAPDFKKIFQFIKDLPKTADQFIYEFEKAEAEVLLTMIKKHIQAQDLNWVPLKEGYARRKRRLELNPGIWIATEDLYHKLQVVEENGKFYIGAPAGVIHKPSGLEINKIIGILEYGTYTERIPARPLFEPSKREVKRGIPKRFVIFSKNYIKRIITQS